MEARVGEAGADAAELQGRAQERLAQRACRRACSSRRRSGSSKRTALHHARRRARARRRGCGRSGTKRPSRYSFSTATRNESPFCSSVLKSTSQAKISARSRASWSSSPASVTAPKRLEVIAPCDRRCGRTSYSRVSDLGLVVARRCADHVQRAQLVDAVGEGGEQAVGPEGDAEGMADGEAGEVVDRPRRLHEAVDAGGRERVAQHARPGWRCGRSCPRARAAARGPRPRRGAAMRRGRGRAMSSTATGAGRRGWAGSSSSRSATAPSGAARLHPEADSRACPRALRTLRDPALTELRR